MKDIEIIKYLIEKKNEEVNIAKISRELKIDYKNTYLIVKKIEKESLVKLESFGHSTRVKLTQQVHPAIFEAEYKRRQDLLRNKNLAVMLNEFKKRLQSKFYVLLIFGPYAKKTQTKHSDIDLMFIAPNKQEDLFDKEIHHISRLLPLPMHFLVFSEEQFSNMADSKDSNVVKEALKNNVVLNGIEDYYRIIENLL